MPQETKKNASLAERNLATYIRRNRSKLDTEIKIRLNGLDDHAGCASFAKSHLMQLERHNCSPPADLVRILQVIAQVPAQSVILKEKFEFVQESTHRFEARESLANENTFAIAPILPYACRAPESPHLLEWRCTSCSTRQKIVPRLLLR